MFGLQCHNEYDGVEGRAGEAALVQPTQPINRNLKMDARTLPHKFIRKPIVVTVAGIVGIMLTNFLVTVDE